MKKMNKMNKMYNKENNSEDKWRNQIFFQKL